MVQLSSRYDSTLKKKVFILKGDEAYARTTEVLANLITFDDFDNYIHYCHVGLEIEVLRELGDSYLYIYNNDEMLYDVPIPYNDSGMAEIIDSEWNEKGVYWINNKLVIGKKSENPLVNTGLYLPYDVENKIRVEYVENDYCLGSESKPISLIVPTPDTFESTLTLWSDDPSYSPSATVNDVQLLFECENETENSKTVKIYDNDNLVTTETVMQDVPITLTLGELSDGLHILKAVFEGDGEAYASETSYSISVGYKITNLEYPSYVIQGNAGTLSCKVTDYLDVPIEGYIKLEEYSSSTWTEIASQVEAGSDGSVTFTNVAYSNNPFAVTIGSYHDTQHTINIINPTDITVAFDNPRTMEYESNRVSGTLLSDNSPITVNGIAISLEFVNPIGSISYTTYTNSNGIFALNVDGDLLSGTEYVYVNARIGNLRERALWNRYSHWWSSSNNQFNGTSTNYNVTVVRKSNGFGLTNSSSAWGNVSFLFSERRSGSFKVINKGTGSSKLMGRTFNELGINNGETIEFLIDYSEGDGNHVELFKNSIRILNNINYPKLGLDIDIASKDSVIIDELKIERIS